MQKRGKLKSVKFPPQVSWGSVSRIFDNFFMYFFFGEDEECANRRKSYKPCNHKAILIHSRGILTHTPIERNQKKQKLNSKMQNSWLTIKTWKMSWSKSTFHGESSVIEVLGKLKSILKPCFLFVCILACFAFERQILDEHTPHKAFVLQPDN